MKILHLALLPLATATLSEWSPAAVIDSTVITDLVDVTNFNEARPLGVSISGDSAVYMVGTMNIDTEIGSLNGSFREANMGIGTNFIAGFGNGFGGPTIVIAENGTEATAPESFAQGVPTVLAMKFDQTTGDTTLWVNPDFGTTEALNPPSATATVGSVNGATFDSVIFRGGDFTAPDSVVDFTDFSVYYGGDSPFVPEPSSLALLAMGGLIAARRRR